MIKDYHNLKRYCDTSYTINNKELKIGNLNDNQLNISYRILSNKKQLNRIESNQLVAIDYIINYRSEAALKKVRENLEKQKIVNATKIANGASLWGEKVITNIINSRIK